MSKLTASWTWQLRGGINLWSITWWKDVARALTYKSPIHLVERSGRAVGCLQRHFQGALFGFTLECIVIHRRSQITPRVKRLSWHELGLWASPKRLSHWQTRDLHLFKKKKKTHLCNFPFLLVVFFLHAQNIWRFRFFGVKSGKATSVMLHSEEKISPFQV